jgi:arsenate reductase (thioredoxin)
MDKKRVLFVCIHNSARSQMGEAYLKQLGGEKYEVESAGITPGSLNPFAVRVMAEDGIDISRNLTKSVFDFYKQGRFYSYVITVCDKEAAEQCPIFPGNGKRLHWSFADPSRVEGTEEEKLAKVRSIRDEIKARVIEFIREGN